ncbi:MAG TPA: preprotein translocase subunit SecY [Candidatus Thermoplasmatota archaeon]|nr:preprotein translocase subunit SecY [Candidatus Thermoplasmatota archaeon]
MAEEKKSRLYVLKPLIERWPAVAKPEGHVNFRSKIFWTVICLVLYFILTNVMIYGVSGQILDMFSSYRAIMAGASGSIMHLGIGPIVTASIILQLFVGAKIIKLDLTKKEDKAIYQGSQKVLVIVMIFVEAIPQIYGYLKPSDALASMVGGSTVADLIIILQLFLGAYLVFLMDELISKWGIGSGISMFIAAGVSQSIFTGLVNWLPESTAVPVSVSNPPAGVIPGTYYLATHMSLGDIVDGGFQLMFIGHSARTNAIVPLIGTIAIFLIVTYTESSRIELPLAHAKVRGARGRYPIRLIYASNIPVILMSALLANINMFALLFYTHPSLQNLPLIGHQWWIGAYDTTYGSTAAYAGGAWYLSNLNGVNSWLMPIISGGSGGHAPWQFAAKTIIYLTVMIFGSVLFARFWIETTDMGPTAVAKQIQDSGMVMPGFRRDPRVLGRVLERYIPVVTIIGGAAVGMLASFADAIGTVGNASGTGVLLTVGIMIQMYEQIAREQAMEMHPVLRGFFGAE